MFSWILTIFIMVLRIPFYPSRVVYRWSSMVSGYLGDKQGRYKDDILILGGNEYQAKIRDARSGSLVFDGGYIPWDDDGGTNYNFRCSVFERGPWLDYLFSREMRNKVKSANRNSPDS